MLFKHHLDYSVMVAHEYIERLKGGLVYWSTVHTYTFQSSHFLDMVMIMVGHEKDIFIKDIFNELQQDKSK